MNREDQDIMQLVETEMIKTNDDILQSHTKMQRRGQRGGVCWGGGGQWKNIASHHKHTFGRQSSSTEPRMGSARLEHGF